VARARQSSAERLAIDRRIDEQRARLALAHALRTPDITPEATLTRRAEPEFDTGWRAAIAVSVPLFTTHRAVVRVEDATLAQLTSEREATAARISGEVTAAAAVAESQRQQFVQYRGEIVPQAVRTLAERRSVGVTRTGRRASGALDADPSGSICVTCSSSPREERKELAATLAAANDSGADRLSNGDLHTEIKALREVVSLLCAYNRATLASSPRPAVWADDDGRAAAAPPPATAPPPRTTGSASRTGGLNASYSPGR
jgi:hypothetical protein